MSKRPQHPRSEQFKFSSSRRRLSIPTHSTEFCVRASKLNVGKDKPLSDCDMTPREDYSGSISMADMMGSQRLYHRGLITQASSSSLPNVGNQPLGAAQSLGVMGQKYFKKPSKSNQTEAVKEEGCSSQNDRSSSPRNVLHHLNNDSKQKVGKEANHKTSFVTTEFGFRCGRTDAFSGNTRKRVIESSKLEKHIAEGARKHILACHIAPTARRGCPAIQSYHALRDSVSPVTKFSKYTTSETLSTSLADHRSKPCIAKLKMSKSIVTMSTTSLCSSHSTKLPEVVGTLVQQTPKRIHQAA